MQTFTFYTLLYSREERINMREDKENGMSKWEDHKHLH
jgi:hypothetical protein